MSRFCFAVAHCSSVLLPPLLLLYRWCLKYMTSLYLWIQRSSGGTFFTVDRYARSIIIHSWASVSAMQGERERENDDVVAQGVQKDADTSCYCFCLFSQSPHLNSRRKKMPASTNCRQQMIQLKGRSSNSAHSYGVSNKRFQRCRMRCLVRMERKGDEQCDW